MATDIAAILQNLGSCYNFTGKSVIHVGAGGGQFIGYAFEARSALGVDPDPEAVARLTAALQQKEVLGAPVLSRIQRFAGHREITIEMPYRIALLSGKEA